MPNVLWWHRGSVEITLKKTKQYYCCCVGMRKNTDVNESQCIILYCHKSTFNSHVNVIMGSYLCSGPAHLHLSPGHFQPSDIFMTFRTLTFYLVHFWCYHVVTWLDEPALIRLFKLPGAWWLDHLLPLARWMLVNKWMHQVNSKQPTSIHREMVLEFEWSKFAPIQMRRCWTTKGPARSNEHILSHKV